MGRLYNKDKKKSTSTGTTSKNLESLLKIAEESGLGVPEQKPTLLERLVGALRASETSGIAADIQSGKSGGEVLKNYGSRLAKGWAGRGLDEEDLSGVEGYKDVLTRAGVSDDPLFQIGKFKPSTAGIAGFAGDILLDPLTYVTAGTTKLGKEAGKTATRESLEALSKRAGREYVDTIAKEGTEFAGKRVGKALGKTSAQQAKLGQKSLLNVLGQPVVPRKVNEFVYENIDKGFRKLGETQIGATIDAARKIFKDDMIPLAKVGTEEAFDLKLESLASRVGKNVEQKVTRESYDKALSLTKKVGEVAGKDIDKGRGIMSEVINAVEKTKPGEALPKLDDSIMEIAQEAKAFRDYIHTYYTKIGGANLADEEIGYWLHTLVPSEKDKLQKVMGLGSREWNNKLVSERIRKYGKLVDENGKEYVGNIEDIAKELNLTPADNYIVKLQGRRDKIEKMLDKRIAQQTSREAQYGEKLLKALGQSETKGEVLLKSRKDIVASKLKSIKEKIRYIEEETMQGLRYPISDKEAMKAATNKVMKKIREASATGMDGSSLAKDIYEITSATGRSGEFNLSPELLESIMSRLDDLNLEKEILEIEERALSHGGVRRLTSKQAISQGDRVAKGLPKIRRTIESAQGMTDLLTDIKASKLKEIDDILEKVDPNSADKYFFKRGVNFVGDEAVPSSLKNEVLKFKNATIKELNDSKLGFEFSEDLGMTMYMMGKRLGKKAGGTEYLSLAQGLGKSKAMAPSNWVKSSSELFKGKDLVFSPEVAKHIDNTYKAYITDEPVNELLKVYDKIQNLFKSSVTSIYPAFHTRNFISNIWQNYLGDVKGIKPYTDSIGILSKVESGGIEALSKKEAKLYQSFLDNGLSGFGYFGGDVEKNIASKLTKEKITAKNAIPKGYQALNRGGMWVGNKVEDTGKLAHFIDKINKGYSSADAASSVRKYLFDYTDLTDTERIIFKRIAPFYTFTRKNLPLELEALITQPGKFGNLNKLMRAGGYTPGEEGVPSYLREKPYYNTGDGNIVSGGLLDVPAFEPLELVGETPGRSLEKTTSKLLSPLLKVPLESATDRSLFRGKPLSESTNVEPVYGKLIMKNDKIKEALGVQEIKSGKGDVYYITSNPELWNVMRAFLSRAGGTVSSASKIKEKDFNTAWVLANLATGIKPDVKGGAMESMSSKELEKRLFEFLRKEGKAYKFSLYGESK